MEIQALLKQMTLEEKIGQICVPILQKGEITPEIAACIREYGVGMIRYCPNAEFDNASAVVGEPNPYLTAAGTAAFTSRLQELARQTAQEQGLTLREGVYFYCYGPQYETPAEVRAARILGGDAVGMSTAPEVVVAGHCGMEVLGITLLSNMAAGILDQPLSEQEVLDAAEAAKEKFSGLIRACLRRM